MAAKATKLGVPNILHTASTGNVDSKSSIKTPRRLIYFKLIWGGGLFNLEKTIVSVLHKELQLYKTEKLKYKKVGGHATKDQNEIRTSSR